MLSFEDDTPIQPSLGLQTIRVGPAKSAALAAAETRASLADVSRDGSVTPAKAGRVSLSLGRGPG